MTTHNSSVKVCQRHYQITAQTVANQHFVFFTRFIFSSQKIRSDFNKSGRMYVVVLIVGTGSFKAKANILYETTKYLHWIVFKASLLIECAPTAP